MKVFRLIILITSLILTSELSAQNQQNEANYLENKISVRVDGLACPFCARGLETKLVKLDGVEKVEVDIENAVFLLVVKEDKKIAEKAIRQAVVDAGFTPREIKEIDKKPDE